MQCKFVKRGCANEVFYFPTAITDFVDLTRRLSHPSLTLDSISSFFDIGLLRKKNIASDLLLRLGPTSLFQKLFLFLQ